MSTFQRDVAQPLLELRLRLEAGLRNRDELASVSAMLGSVEKNVEVFDQRAKRADSPYGEQMRGKIANALAEVQRMKQQVAEAAEQLPTVESSVPVEPSPPEPAPNGTGSSNISVPQLAGPVTTSPESKQSEALRRILEREEQLKKEDRERHQAAVAVEKQRRAALYQEQQRKFREEHERRESLMRRYITLGRVNHVMGRNDFESKLSAAGKRACIIDWFAPWCGPCRQIAPHFERLAMMNPEVVFMSIDTEQEPNKEVFHSSGVRAFPTFQIIADGKTIRRIEGANVVALEQAIQEASVIAEEAILTDTLMLSSFQEELVQEVKSDLSKPTPGGPKHSTQSFMLSLRIIGPKKGDSVIIRVPSSATVQELVNDIKKHRSIDKTALVTNGMLLDSRRMDFTIYSLGLRDANTVRIISLPQAHLTIKLKIVEHVHSVQVRPTTTLAFIRRKAQELTKTSSPKIVYLGKVLPDEQDSLVVRDLKLDDGSTLLCLPFGGEWQPPQETAEVFGPRALNLHFREPHPVIDRAIELFIQNNRNEPRSSEARRLLRDNPSALTLALQDNKVDNE